MSSESHMKHYERDLLEMLAGEIRVGDTPLPERLSMLRDWYAEQAGKRDVVAEKRRVAEAIRKKKKRKKALAKVDTLERSLREESDRAGASEQALLADLKKLQRIGLDLSALYEAKESSAEASADPE